jgi:hypothetical protein
VSELRARVGSAVVTPDRPGELAGYAARDGALSTGTHDDLIAALLVLDDGLHRTGWLTIDAIGVTAPLAERLHDALRGGLADPDARIVIAASHSHSAPLGWVGSIHPGHAGAVDAAAVDDLVQRVRRLAEEVAARPAEVVEAGWSTTRVRGLGANRLDPAREADDSIALLALRSVADGGLRAVLLNATAHPTVLGPGNLRWSADWPGAARRALRAALGEQAAFGEQAASGGSGAPVVLFLQGAAGDVSTRFTRRGDGFAEAARLGALAAAAALDALQREPRRLEGPVRHASHIVEMARRPLPSRAEADLDLARATSLREELRDLPELDPRVRIAQARLDGAAVQQGLVAAAPPGSVALPVSVTAIGDVAWAHVPVELFASVGAAIRDGSPFSDTRVVGYADGYSGYLVDAAAAESGSYEALSTLFPVSAGDELAWAVHQLLEEIR